jgi:hypothetical protein
LAVGASFAAIILRRINIDTFGFHFVGDTSSGKTLSLRVASSVPGFNSQAGVTSWDGTSTGFEQLALGRRDNVMPLDETGLIAGDHKAVAKFVQLTTFRFSNNRPKVRAGDYTRKHTVDSDTRNIILSTGEDVLPVHGQVRGQDVRLIQIWACVSDFGDIYDAKKAHEIVGETTEQREEFVTKLEASTRQFQGVAELDFSRQLFNDSEADNKLNAAVDEFISKSPIPKSQSSKVFARLRRRFAAVYAGSALAIDYDILPFDKDATLRDLRKCMYDAIDLLNMSQATGSSATCLSDGDLIAQFRQHLIGAKFIKAGAYAKKSLTIEQIETADGFINYTKPEKYRVMLQTHRLRAWYPDDATRSRLVKLLRSREIFLTGRQPDTCSRQVKFRPHPNKISVYWLSLKALGLKTSNLQIG